MATLIWMLTKTKAIHVPFRKSLMDVIYGMNMVNRKNLQKGLVLVNFALKFQISQDPKSETLLE